MKKLFAFLVCLFMFIPTIAFADSVDIEQMSESQKQLLLIALLNDANEDTLNGLLAERVSLKKKQPCGAVASHGCFFYRDVFSRNTLASCNTTLFASNRKDFIASS